MGVWVWDRPVQWMSRKSISFVEVVGCIFVYARRVLFAESSIVSVFLDSNLLCSFAKSHRNLETSLFEK